MCIYITNLDFLDPDLDLCDWGLTDLWDACDFDLPEATDSERLDVADPDLLEVGDPDRERLEAGDPDLLYIWVEVIKIEPSLIYLYFSDSFFCSTQALYLNVIN